MSELSQIISTLPSLRLTVDAHGLMAKKALGQNFLLDSNITDKIIRSSLDAQNKKSFSDDHVYEIGPGPGGLTRSILKANPQKLTVIEMDERCINIMEEIRDKTGNVLEIVNDDALRFDFTQQEKYPKQIVSNLPYNISVPLLTGWLKNIKEYSALTLMFQKEVADRITAQLRTKDYGRISILAQLQCKITRLFDLNPECFVPAPKIWSTVLLFEPQPNPLTLTQIKKLESLTTQAFAQRRKMIRQSLKSISDLEQKCATVGISLTSRPEEISPQQFLELSAQI
ncbi:MAG: 16S rRNA (adenine(1518)-N(6)/adenine(1519)-N(6))-dimethyltransferase RsmA [Alphaproteobacteria bacterium]|nr:16S rRNA (adenine(1518)-N(6)/adenine(1519)-N(6))-dimethyltransferase RsmA [Alphaproteobacteria bacterium]